MIEQSPAFTLLAPFFAAIIVALLGIRIRWICFPLVFFSLAISVIASLYTLFRTLNEGTIHYFLDGWSPPIGIEYSIDGLNALVTVVISLVGLIVSVYSRQRVIVETPDKVSQFYTLYLLLIAGLIGMVMTGDAFNLYVLIEVSSLTSYGLIAIGSKRATFASFKYIIMGTIGAAFYLLGVGYLYIKTGSLNMLDIQEQLVARELFGSQSIMVAFILITVGVWIKMAFFPLHAWLPNAYAFAPTTTSTLLAPLVTKVMIYTMIRMMLTVFSPEYSFIQLDWNDIIIWMAIVAILAGSVAALWQTDLRKMLSFLIIAEVGYMVGGVWLAEQSAMIGAIYHIISDAFMTLCVFLFAGIIFAQTGKRDLNAVEGMFKKMPLTMMAFVVGAFSFIGIPPTCGFFSKWYLIQGGINSGHWEYVIALLISSLINAVLFFRIIEIAYFGTKPAEGHGHHHSKEHNKTCEASPSMLIPLFTTAVLLLVIGIFNQPIIGIITDFVVATGIR